MMQAMRQRLVLWALGVALLLPPAPGYAQETVAEVMDGLVTRLYASRSLEELRALDHAAVLAMLSPREREVLATKHLMFTVDVPVVVSVLRNVEQAVTPFWLEEAGFQKTDLSVTNLEGWRYEVWQKDFPAGRVGLGINGFDWFRPHYLVAVAPQGSGATVTLSDLWPAEQRIVTLEPGAQTYRDWTELVLTEVPESLRGQQLLTTIRGRGGEAALVGAFRETPFPSGPQPDPVYLTWSADPRTTQNIQWRTSAGVAAGAARIRKQGAEEFEEVTARLLKMEDRMLANDRYCHWFTAVATGLQPATVYEYQVGSPEGGWSETRTFTTAPEKDAPFAFFFCSDTHSNEQWGKLLEATAARVPEAAFTVISGDLVGTGMEREDWDMFLAYGQPVFQTRPVMPAVGNHDAQLGLGKGMYLDIFGLPEAGPEGIEPESAYTFSYGNAQFFMLDVMSPRAPQAAWLDRALAQSTATWKIAVFHFPPYAQRREYREIEELWCTLFDKYGVDLVLTGHVHTHLRSYPLRGGQPVRPPERGTVYLTSISIPSRPARDQKPEYIETWVGGGLLCNVLRIDGPTLTHQALNMAGEVKDSFTLSK